MADGSDASYLTLSVWRDENALRGFMLHDPHRQVMRRLGRFAVGRFVRFPIRGSELPPTWLTRSRDSESSERGTWRSRTGTYPHWFRRLTGLQLAGVHRACILGHAQLNESTSDTRRIIRWTVH